MTEIAHDDRPTLVLGGTGKTGRRIVERLKARGVPVRVGSRSGTPRFDWDDRSTWAPALQGVGAAYISYYPDLTTPGAPEAVRALADLAVDQGVGRLVLVSGRGEDEAQRAEREVQATGAEVTIVRCAWFMQNFSEDYLLDPIRAGEVVLPATDDQLEPFVDADDIADVAVAALTEPGHAGQVYELTSPRLLNYPEAVAEIAKAAGREIQYVPVSVEDYAAGAAEHGVPAGIVGMLTYLFSDVLGTGAYVTDGVQRALGRPARDFSDYAARTAATGIWNPPTDR
ncbi:MAG TPA: NAD(P)H-binding protein [Acidimicrobiales bacterium]